MTAGARHVDTAIVDGDLQLNHVGEARQAHAPGFVGLAEDDFLLGSVHRAPGPHAPLQAAADAGMQFRVTTHQLLEQRHRARPGGRPQQRNDLLLEDPGQRIGAPAPARAIGGLSVLDCRGNPTLIVAPHCHLDARDETLWSQAQNPYRKTITSAPALV